jgi:hypothetical protein
VAQHQLDDADVHAVSQEPAGALVSEVVPAEIDPPQLLPVPLAACPAAPRLPAVRQQPKRLPGGLDVRLVGSARTTSVFEHSTEGCRGR